MLTRAALGFLVAGLALTANAQVIPCEWVQPSGPDNVVDSNASSCDPRKGCHDVNGRARKDAPGFSYNLQIVPRLERKSRSVDTCGTIGARPCAIFDLDELGPLIAPGDPTQFHLLDGKLSLETRNSTSAS